MNYAVDLIEGLSTLKSFKNLKVSPFYKSPPEFKFLSENMGVGDLEEWVIPNFSKEDYRKYLSEELRLPLTKVGVDVTLQGNEHIYIEIYSDRSVEIESIDAKDEEGLIQQVSALVRLKTYKLKIGGVEK